MRRYVLGSFGSFGSFVSLGSLLPLAVRMLLPPMPAAHAQPGGGSAPPALDRSERPPLSFETIAARMEQEERDGFSGSILVVHDDRIALSRGYGFADREARIRATPETIYGIGSTPIDFTRAGVLLLAQEGKLLLDDPITKFFADVPADKRGITVEHLMSAASGLQDFHDLPSDRDPDHGWIDRDEAMRRIWAQKLLFEPGRGRAHSHSAWGVLAAILEIATGESYPEFARRRLFEPAGMRDTGFFGEPIPRQRVAIGYGPRRDGEINAPPYWGRTSWLVMGSGGQTSTTLDMHRWLVALRAGRILSPPWLERYWAPPGAVLAGGDMYGFEMVYTQGPGDLVIVMSNGGAGPQSPRWRRLTGDLVHLVQPQHTSRYALGIQLEPAGDGRAVVRAVVPGSAAERDGLLPGDVLVSAGGRAIGAEPMQVLAPYLQSGDAIVFEVERGGAPRRIEVRPKPRGE